MLRGQEGVRQIERRWKLVNTGLTSGVERDVILDDDGRNINVPRRLGPIMSHRFNRALRFAVPQVLEYCQHWQHVTTLMRPATWVMPLAQLSHF